MSLTVARTVAEVHAALAPVRRAGGRIGFVPTMGAFHDGHAALMRAAREQCDFVAVSLFVNPTQFQPGEDLAAYPRDERRDLAIARRAGAELVFAPTEREIYPDGFATTVRVGRALTGRLEGAVRGPEHFDGVTTVVAKLLAIFAPHAAFFGAKDAQQLVVVRRMVRDLAIAVEVVACPTVREPDGLAMSSRNAYLDAGERARAVALHAALREAARAAASGEREPARIVARARSAMEPYDVEPEYLELVSPDDLEPVAELDGPALVAVAARVGATRLIDNAVIEPTPEPEPRPRSQRAAVTG